MVENDHHAQLQQPVLPPEASTQLDEVMTLLPVKLHETAEDIERRLAHLRNESLASTSKEKIQRHLKFIPKLQLRHSVLNQVSPAGKFYVTQTHRSNANIQLWEGVTYVSELPPNHVAFTSRFFQNLH